jgi:hypothetical protein
VARERTAKAKRLAMKYVYRFLLLSGFLSLFAVPALAGFCFSHIHLAAIEWEEGLH